MKTKYLFLLTLGVSHFLMATDLAFESWIKEQKTQAFEHLMQNVSAPGTSKGSIIASPSKKDPDYFYHWIRDAGITMQTVLNRYLSAKSSHERDRLEESLLDFATFTLKNQSAEGSTVGAGEVKYYVNGEPFLGPWGRPQNDGPALRALVFTRFAQTLLAEGKESLVREKIYNGKSNSIVKFDLDYVAKKWQDQCVDLWEEVHGRHLFTALVQKRALLEGSELANRLGDPEAGQWYKTEAKKIDGLINRFWDAGKQLIVPTIDWKAGLNYKSSGLDSSVIIGILLSEGPHSVFPIQDTRVQKTALALEKSFYDIYVVNQNGKEGVLIGRYPEDQYDGLTHSTHQGNPWVLNTAYFAQYYYKLARMAEPRKPVIDEFGFEKTLKMISQAFRGKGDTFLSRLKFHAGVGNTFSEQMNRNSGFMQSAHDLTWSYGSIVDAVDARP